MSSAIKSSLPLDGGGVAGGGVFAVPNEVCRPIPGPSPAWREGRNEELLPRSLSCLEIDVTASFARIVAVFRWEMRTFFLRPTTYLLLLGMTLLAAWSFAWLVTLLSRGIPPLRRSDDPIAQFLGPNIFLIGAVTLLVPLLTMNLVADERRRGTWELLATAPVSLAELLGGKWLAAFCQLAVCLSPWPACLVALRSWNGGTVWLWNVVPWFAGPGVDFDAGPVAAAVLALALIGMLFTALGLCSSLCCRRPVSAALLTACCLIVFLLLSFVPQLLQHAEFSSSAIACADAVSVWGHLDSFSRGIVSPRVIAAYVSVSVLLFIGSVAMSRRLL